MRLLFVVFLLLCGFIYLQGADLKNESVIKSTQSDVVDPFTDPDPIKRRSAINEAVSKRDLSKLDAIEKTIYDESKIVRITAIEGLGVLRSQRSYDKIVDILLKETDRDIKNSCLIAISYLPQIEKPEKLIEYYNKEKDEALKGQVLRILGSRNMTILEKEMIKAVSSEKTPDEIKKNAIIYLGMIKSTSSLSAIQKLVESSNKSIKIEAIRALGEIGDRSSIDILMARMGENDQDIRFESAVSLAKIGEKSSLEVLYNYIDSKNLSYRDRAIDAIGMIGNEKSITVLEEKMKKIEDPSLKAFISFTIERIKARLRLAK